MHFFGPKTSLLLISYISLLHFYTPVKCEMVEITDSNYEGVIAKTELLLVNFYSENCMYSRNFAPIFEAAGNKIPELYPNQTNIKFGRVDGDKNEKLLIRHKVAKFPTVKLVRYGFIVHTEYRGPRTVEALLDFVKLQFDNPVQYFSHPQDIIDSDDDPQKKLIIGYFSSNASKSHSIFVRVANTLKDDCTFYAKVGERDSNEVSETKNPTDGDLVVFRVEKSSPVESDEPFKANLENFHNLLGWAFPKCFALVREITFENAEEIVDEGIPLVVLFYHPNNKTIVKDFTQMVNEHLRNESQMINFLTADGKVFSHPLVKLEKKDEDLPLLAADSFVHMYEYPKTKDIMDPESIREFVTDLNSGKLHREFHDGPDPPPETQGVSEPPEDTSVGNGVNVPPVGVTLPPESAFVKLAPSEKRYTFIKDEF